MKNASPAQRELGKLDIVRALAARYDYRRYLEITTGETGHVYAEARRAGFEDCRRLVYRLGTWKKYDEQPIDYPHEGDDTREAIAQMHAQGLNFDVVLVDPHHTYACSARDIADAFGLIRTSGALVVHDCNPPDATIASPVYVSGDWCGVTYKAFLDFVLGNDEVRHFTVDTDYGCGVILKRPPRTGLRRLRDLADRATMPARRRKLLRQWRATGDNYDAAWALFERERTRLLRLMPPDEFIDTYGAPPPLPEPF